MSALTKESIISELKDIFMEVAPQKIIDDITLETSLIEDFAFDSIDLVNTLLKIREQYSLNTSSPQELINFINDSEDELSVNTICELILEKA